MKFSLLPVASLAFKALRQPTVLYSSTNESPKSPKEQLCDEIVFRAASALPLVALAGFGPKCKVAVNPDYRALLSPSDLATMKQTIAEGRIYVKDDFIPVDLVEALRKDIHALADEGFFKPSGLSNWAKGEGDKQGFGQQDRSVCPVVFEDPNMSQNVQLVGSKLRELRSILRETLKRPSLTDDTLAHESYFSRSLPGSSLKRHLDERHEETKGRKGWSTPSRRSITWLVYLSEPGWTTEVNGGGLRAFPQSRAVAGPPSGSDNGNLQVGWWRRPAEPTKASSFSRSRDDDDDSREVVEPVFLDSWIKEPRQLDENGSAAPPTYAARCALYLKGAFPGFGSRRYLTKRFDMRDPVTGKMRDDFDDVFLPAAKLEVAAAAAAATTNSAAGATTTAAASPNAGIGRSVEIPGDKSVANAADRFLRIEDINAWAEGKIPAGSTPVVVCPRGGTLVLFDSVSLPHEVMETLKGERLALAGWFHEKQQEFPDWYLG